MTSRGQLEARPDWLLPVTLRADGTCAGAAHSIARIRGHAVTIDEPAERGGTDQGPAPTELMIAALVGVTHVMLQRLARRDGVAIASMSIGIEAVLDRRGVWLAEPVAVPWIEIRSTIRIATPADDARLAIWTEDLPRFSPLHATLHGAGTRLTTTWERATAAS